MSSKPAFNEEIFKSHETAFIEHYEWLRRWALQLTHHDRERAEDLVQEVFAQFATAHTDLSVVQNIPAYLYTTLRNIHVSQVRLAGRSHGQAQSIVDYSGAEAALEATDPYTIFQTQDQLRRVCQYACLRKQSSRAGSVLILRYFHGYHVSEIAGILRGTFQAVRQQLTFARNEARLFLENPQALKIIQHASPGFTAGTHGVCSADRLLIELRKAIFDSCQGECISSGTLSGLYTHGLVSTADNSTVAHIVSCPLCLDQVNARLGLPLLAERHPADTLGPNNDWRDGTRGPRDSGGSGSAVPSRRRGKNDEEKISGPLLTQCRRRATELFERYPRELCVSVNGYVLGSQSVSSPVSRLRLDVTIAEELNFVEVLSEERARLLVMTIEPPPYGEPVQYRRLRLSENRTLEVSFHYGHPWPMVEVMYDEPDLLAQSQQMILVPDKQSAIWSVACSETPVLQTESRYTSSLFGLFGRLNPFRSLWLHPAFITAIVSLVLTGILLTFWRGDRPRVTAANLLERATAQESLTLPVNVAMHRVVELEQRRRSDGAVIGKNRIEVWRDDVRGLSVRRIYDHQGRLTTGVWSEEKPANGKPLRRIYHRGRGQRIETGVEDPARAIRDSELWQLDPSAIIFTALLSRPEAARVTETVNEFVVAYAAGQGPSEGLIQAILTLRKSDLHPIAQTLVINGGGEISEYRFVEVVYERPRLELVSPAVFEPDAEFLSKTDAVAPASARRAHSSLVASPSPAMVAELELDVAYALDRFRTRFGDQLNLIKTPAGRLEIRGVVDSDETRKEIREELSRVAGNHSAVRVQLETTTELLGRRAKEPNRVIVRDFAGSDQSIPLYSELSRYFAAHEGRGQTEQYRDQLVRAFAAQMVSRSQRAVAHSLELKQLGSRFSAAQLDQFTPSARAKWVSLVRNHAEALQRELSTLDGELQQILTPNQSGEAERVQISSSAALPGEIDRLHRLVVAIDQAVRSSFAASSGAAINDGVKSARFRSGLATAARVAEEIQHAVADK
jgi:RNA polymerase sigma factor (sigma-70 family)